MYFQVTAKCEEVNESSYTRQLADGSQELVEKVQFSLVVPGMRDRVLCEMPKLAAPKPDLLDKWELEEAWIVVSADGTAYGRSALPAPTRGRARRRWVRWWSSRPARCVRRARTSGARCSRHAKRRRCVPSNSGPSAKPSSRRHVPRS